jgi:hypothetical protein
MAVSYHNGCPASCLSNCISSSFFLVFQPLFFYCLRFLDAKYVSAFFLRYLYEVSGCDFGMLQVDLRSSYMASLFMFPCIARCVEFAYRRHFNSLCFACTFIIIPVYGCVIVADFCVLIMQVVSRAVYAFVFRLI